MFLCTWRGHVASSYQWKINKNNDATSTPRISRRDVTFLPSIFPSARVDQMASRLWRRATGCSKEPESFNDQLEKSSLPTRNTYIGVLCKRRIHFYFGRELQFCNWSVIAMPVPLTYLIQIFILESPVPISQGRSTGKSHQMFRAA